MPPDEPWYQVYLVGVNHRSDRLHMWLERQDGKPVECGWDLLQQIKNETIGAQFCMVEFFPPADHVVNETNRRHFWSVDIPLPMEPA